MTVNAAVRRLQTDLKHLRSAKQELRSDQKDIRADRKELGRDRSELKRDLKAGDRLHKSLDTNRAELAAARAGRQSATAAIEAERQAILARYNGDTFEAAPALQVLDTVGGEVLGKFDSMIASEQSQVAADQAGIVAKRAEIKSDRAEIKHDGKVIEHDKKELVHDRKDIQSDRARALKDLRPAEYHMGLKATNQARRELGLKAVDHVIRPASGKVETMLDLARANLGYHEGAGNSNKFSAAMGRPAEAWCADFVSYLAHKAGLRTPNTASAQGIADQLRAAGQWKGKHNPQPGDAVTFRWDGSGGWADHVGIVEKVFTRNGRTYVQTIEGNSGDAVRRKVYPANASVINGYGRIVH